MILQHGRHAPWAHQRAAFEFALNRSGSLLALDMGCGKSAVAIWLAYTWACKRALVACPLSVMPVWPRQIEEHWPVSTEVPIISMLTGSVKEKTSVAKHAHAHYAARPVIFVINHESVWREPFRSFALSVPWDLTIVDECHLAKQPGGKFSMFLARLRDCSRRRLGLTGTPMPHSPLDIYAQARFLDPSIFGTSFTRFRARYAIMGGYQGHQVIGFQNQGELARKLDLFTFRVKASDVLDLPPFQHITIPVTLQPTERETYVRLERLMVAEVEAGTVTAANALVKLLRLAQVTGGFVATDDGPTQALGESKYLALCDLLEDLPAHEPVVVFARFHHDLDMIHTAAERAGKTSSELSGRVNELATWQAGSTDVLAVQEQSGGVGIDLTRARYCIYFSASWNLGAHEQSLARVHRPGQTRPVFYYHLVATGTVDETVNEALRAKKNVVEAVLERLGGGR